MLPHIVGYANKGGSMKALSIGLVGLLFLIGSVAQASEYRAPAGAKVNIILTDFGGGDVLDESAIDEIKTVPPLGNIAIELSADTVNEKCSGFVVVTFDLRGRIPKYRTPK